MTLKKKEQKKISLAPEGRLCREKSSGGAGSCYLECTPNKKSEKIALPRAGRSVFCWWKEAEVIIWIICLAQKMKRGFFLNEIWTGKSVLWGDAKTNGKE